MLPSGSTTYTVNPALRAKLSYDPVRDFAPVAIVARAPLVWIVPAASPWTKLAGLVAAAKAKPGGIDCATFGAGSGPHLSAALLELAAGLSPNGVPYKGSAPALTDLVGGRIHAMVDTVASAAPQVKAGKVRAIAVLGPARASALPQVPTVGEQGLPEAVFDAWHAVAVPAKVPAEARQRLARELAATMAEPALQQQLRAQALDPVFIGEAPTRARIDAEIAQYRAVAYRAKIVVERALRRRGAAMP